MLSNMPSSLQISTKRYAVGPSRQSVPSVFSGAGRSLNGAPTASNPSCPAQIAPCSAKKSVDLPTVYEGNATAKTISWYSADATKVAMLAAAFGTILTSGL